MDSVVQFLIDAIIRQGEFLVSLASATVGGCIAIIGWQVARAEASEAQRFRGMFLIVVGIIFMCLSIAAFYFGNGIIISAIPDLAVVEKTPTLSGDEFRQRLRDAGLLNAQICFALQMLSFAVAAIAILAFAIRNYWAVQSGRTR